MKDRKDYYTPGNQSVVQSFTNVLNKRTIPPDPRKISEKFLLGLQQ